MVIDATEIARPIVEHRRSVVVQGGFIRATGTLASIAERHELQALHCISTGIHSRVEANELSWLLSSIGREGSEGQIHITTAVYSFGERGEEPSAIGLHKGLERDEMRGHRIHKLNGLDGRICIATGICRRVMPQYGVLLRAVSRHDGIHVGNERSSTGVRSADGAVWNGLIARQQQVCWPSRNDGGKRIHKLHLLNGRHRIAASVCCSESPEQGVF